MNHLHFRASLHIHTGCGKSGIIALAPYVLNCKRYLVIAPNLNIKNQLSDDMDHLKIQNFCRAKSVIIERDLPKLGDLNSERPICVINAQQIKKILLNSYDTFDLVAVDEAHHWPAKTWKNIVQHFHNAKVIFLTATPFRSDGMEEVERVPFFNPIFKYTYHDGVAHGVIKEFEPMINLENSYLVIEQVIQKLGDLPEQKALIYCLNNERAIVVQDMFSEEHSPTIINIHQGSKEEIQNKISDFKDNPLLRIAIVNNMLKEGFDCPSISIVAILDPFNTDKNQIGQIKGKKAYIQFVGRAVRRHASNTINRAYIITETRFNQQIIHDDYMEGEEVELDLNEVIE